MKIRHCDWCALFHLVMSTWNLLWCIGKRLWFFKKSQVNYFLKEGGWVVVEIMFNLKTQHPQLIIRRKTPRNVFQKGGAGSFWSSKSVNATNIVSFIGEDDFVPGIGYVHCYIPNFR